jgi:aarF domain-containing kinase
MATPSPSVEASRRKYAKLVANIDDAHYPLFQAAITGRAALDGAAVVAEQSEGGGVKPSSVVEKRGSMLDLGENNADEKKKMRNAMVMQEGLMEALFQILRNVPRRMLMLFKVNDLNR